MTDAIVYATDLHLTDKQPVNRITSVKDRSIIKFDRLMALALNHGGVLLVGGDFFEVPCPSYDLLSNVIGVLRNYSDVKVYVVRGNHDFRFLNDFEDTAVSVLCRSGLIQILDIPAFVNGFNIVPFPYSKQLPLVIDNDGANAGKFDLCAHEILAEGKDHPIIGVAHLPIVTQPVPYDHILTKHICTDVDYLLCGHIHMQFEQKIISANKQNHHTTVVNPGCVMRLKRNEASITPKCVYLFRKGSKVYHDYEVLASGEYGVVEFTEPKKEIAEFTKVIKDEEKIDIDDVTDYIRKSTYSKEVQDASLELIKKQQEVME